MAGFLNILGKIFGSKYDKDVKEITPIVDEINKEYEKLLHITNDELRERTAYLKNKINEFVSKERKQINILEKEVTSSQHAADKKEAIYKDIDNLEETILQKIEEILNNILPLAFAVVKETSRRFSDNDYLEVTASNNDKELAAKKDFIEIDSNKAIYKTSWDAAGTEIKWDMTQYDVQLIGGVVLHQGKIAEMQTGE
jgi:preprotein translocase subunit SecA